MAEAVADDKVEGYLTKVGESIEKAAEYLDTLWHGSRLVEEYTLLEGCIHGCRGGNNLKGSLGKIVDPRLIKEGYLDSKLDNGNLRKALWNVGKAYLDGRIGFPDGPQGFSIMRLMYSEIPTQYVGGGQLLLPMDRKKMNHLVDEVNKMDYLTIKRTGRTLGSDHSRILRRLGWYNFSCPDVPVREQKNAALEFLQSEMLFWGALRFSDCWNELLYDVTERVKEDKSGKQKIITIDHKFSYSNSNEERVNRHLYGRAEKTVISGFVE